MSQNSEELGLEDCVVPLSLAQLSEEEGSVSDHALDSDPRSRGESSLLGSIGQITSVFWHLLSLQMQRPGFTALQGIS